MGTADVVVFETDEAYSTDPNMTFKFQDQMNKAFDSSGNPHDVSVTPASKRPDPPTEDPYGTSFTDTLCDGQKQYDTLLPWFKDWYQCRYTADPYDSILLITDAAGGGGIAYASDAARFAVAGSAGIANRDDWPNTYGCDLASYDMNAAVHEAGHNFGLGHSDGQVYTYSTVPDNFYTSPMITGYASELDAQDNTCGNYVESTDDESNDCRQMIYSSCSEDLMYVGQ